MKLRVWHNPRVPGRHFYAEVGSIAEALTVLDLLARYDEYLAGRGVPLGAQAQGIERLVDGEWVEVDEADLEDLEQAA